MREPPFDRLMQRLLSAGVSSKYARRLRAELEDHYRDLERDALSGATSPEAAAAEARHRLGADETIVAEFLRRPELRTWLYRSGLALHYLRFLSCAHRACERVSSAVADTLPLIGRMAAASVVAAMLMVAGLHLMQATIGGRPGAGEIPVASTNAVPDVRLVDRPRESGAVAAGRDDGRLQRPLLEPALERPAYHPQPEEITVLPSSPTVQIAAVAPDAGLAPPLFRVVDADLLPIVRVAPMFPPRAAARGLEGYVVVEYTVTRAGSVTDVVVIESSNAIFERAALEAAVKFRYRPRVVDGEPVAVEGVRTRMSFVLDV